jgi:hypothetical protein
MSDPRSPIPAAPRPAWDERLASIDRRWIYLLLFLATLAPLVFGWHLRLYPTEDARSLYRLVESLPQGKIVVLSCNWEAGTQAESRPQTVALARHLLRRRIPFAILSIGYPTSPQIAQGAVEQAVREEGYGVYGVDYCNWGFRIGTTPWLQALSRNILKAVSTDWKGKRLAELPMMRGVETFKEDVSLLVDITGSSTVTDLISYVHAPTGVPVGFACTAVMAPEAYPLLDSGQLVGMLTGMRGAAEYEQLIGAPGFGVTAMAGQSFAHVFILVLITMGNLPILMAALRRWFPQRRGGGGRQP